MGNKTLYYLDSALYPAAALGVAAVTCRSAAWLVLAAFGILLFTFIEYWVHRTLLHRWFYHGTHEVHHKNPADYVVIWYVPLGFVVLFLLAPAALFAGVTLGFCWFMAMHHVMHHWNLRRHPLLRRLSAWHLLHHKFIRCNFGITHSGWDILFGTYRLLEQPQ